VLGGSPPDRYWAWHGTIAHKYDGRAQRRPGRPGTDERFEANTDMPDRCRKMGLLSPGSQVEIVFRPRLRGCSTVRKDPTPPEMGQRFFGGGMGGPGGSSLSFIQALDFRTGSKAWEYSLSNNGGSGTLATAGELVFFGESGAHSRCSIPKPVFPRGISKRARPGGPHP
jgi:hypothetical protein